MRRTILLLTLVGTVLLACTGVVLAQAATPPSTPPQSLAAKVPNSYIVVFKDRVGRPEAVANEQARSHGLQLKFRYQHAIKGYAAIFPNDQSLQRVRSDDRVAYVEQDRVVSAAPPKSAKPGKKPAKPGGGGGNDPDQVTPWGVTQVGANESSTLAGDGTNPEPNPLSNVDAYIIDTGVDLKHPDLNVTKHVNFAGGQNRDCNGHGTHVAGTVAANDNEQDVVGVAPGASIIGVKVLGCGATGTSSFVVEGVDWVTSEVIGPDGEAGTTDDKKPAIANMSLGFSTLRDTVLDDAVKASADSGVFYTVAAHNFNTDACTFSPAKVGKHPGVMTVAATDSNDQEASFSNYGECVDIWAPGVDVPSTKLGGGTTIMSGTSMATPHVSGGGALYLSSNPNADAATVEDALKGAATNPGTVSKDDTTAILREYVGGF